MIGIVGSNGKSVLDYYSRVYQMNGALVGSGIPYDDASSESLTDTENYNWYANALMWQVMTPEEREEYGLIEQFYQAGIHVNELGIDIKENGADGTVYYFSPDAKIFVNGVPVSSTVINGAYRISSKYYFDVGEIDIYDSVTVDGVKTPVGGEAPGSLDDLTCYDAEGKTNTMTATRLTYFIDKDNDGVCDEGEEAVVRYDEEDNYDAENSTLAEDGTFLYNTVYKVMVAVDLNVWGRFQTGGFTVKLILEDDSEVYANTRYTSSGAPEGAVYAFDKTGKEPIKKYEASLVADVGTSRYEVAFDPWPYSSTHHFRNSSYGYYLLDGEWTGNVLEDGKSYEFRAEFVAEDGYYFADDIAVVIDGVTLTSGVTVTMDGYYLNISYPITLGADVSGRITSFGSATDDVTVQLIEDGTAEPAYETVVKGNSADYSIKNVKSGSYTVKVIKQKHVTAECSITVGTEDVTQNLKLRLLGDLNGSSSVDIIDLVRAKKHMAKAITLSGEDEKAADIDKSGAIDSTDLALLRQILLGVDIW